MPAATDALEVGSLSSVVYDTSSVESLSPETAIEGIPSSAASEAAPLVVKPSEEKGIASLENSHGSRELGRD